MKDENKLLSLTKFNELKLSLNLDENKNLKSYVIENFQSPVKLDSLQGIKIPRSKSSDNLCNQYIGNISPKISRFLDSNGDTISNVGSEIQNLRPIELRNVNNVQLVNDAVNSAIYKQIEQNLNILERINFADPLVRIKNLYKIIDAYKKSHAELVSLVKELSAELIIIKERIEKLLISKEAKVAELTDQLEKFLVKAAEQLNVLASAKKSQSSIIPIMENGYTAVSVIAICYVIIHFGTKYFDYKYSLTVIKPDISDISVPLMKDCAKNLPEISLKVFNDLNFFKYLNNFSVAFLSNEIISTIGSFFKNYYSDR